MMPEPGADWRMDCESLKHDANRVKDLAYTLTTAGHIYAAKDIDQIRERVDHMLDALKRLDHTLGRA